MRYWGVPWPLLAPLAPPLRVKIRRRRRQRWHRLCAPLCRPRRGRRCGVLDAWGHGRRRRAGRAMPPLFLRHRTLTGERLLSLLRITGALNRLLGRQRGVRPHAVVPAAANAEGGKRRGGAHRQGARAQALSPLRRRRSRRHHAAARLPRARAPHGWTRRRRTHARGWLPGSTSRHPRQHVHGLVRQGNGWVNIGRRGDELVKDGMHEMDNDEDLHV